ncbi:MAG: hypothetical protein ACNA8W_16320 [Bradymonadaceae bacterium]
MFTQARTDEVSPELNEQRRKRSDERDTALLHQLDQVVEDFDLDTCLLTDASGKLIAASSKTDPDFSSALAAVSPALATGKLSQKHILKVLRRHAPELSRECVSVREFRAQGKRLYVAAVGKEVLMKEVGILRAILGTRRIHANTH